MKKIVAVMVALMFVFAMAFTSLALADGPAHKGKTPMSDKAKDAEKALKDAKDKAEGKSHEAEMRLSDEKGKAKDKLRKKGKKEEDKMKSKRF